MDVVVTISRGLETGELCSLHGWLTDEQLARCVRLVQRPPEPGALVPVTDALAVALAPGGVAAALSSVAVAWLRRRVGDQTIKITRPDGAVFEMTVTRVRGLDEKAVRALVAELHQWLEHAAPQADNDGESSSAGEIAP